MARTLVPHAYDEAGSVTSVADGVPDYEDLYRTHHDRISRLCRFLLSDPDEADDVTQEVFLKLFRQHQQKDRAMAWGPWLTTVTVNACRDRRRSAWWKWGRVWSDELNEADMPSGAPTPEQVALSRECQRRVWDCFRQLSARQREVFVLRHLEGYSTEETAAVLGTRPGSVKRHLFRAVQHMRTALRGLT